MIIREFGALSGVEDLLLGILKDRYGHPPAKSGFLSPTDRSSGRFFMR